PLLSALHTLSLHDALPIFTSSGLIFGLYTSSSTGLYLEKVCSSSECCIHVSAVGTALSLSYGISTLHIRQIPYVPCSIACSAIFISSSSCSVCSFKAISLPRSYNSVPISAG